MRTPLLLLALVATVAHAAPTVRLGETQRVGRLRITPLLVKEDSRCPMNARCFWAGRVVIRDGRTRVQRDLMLGQPAAPGLVLDSVTPERMAGTPARRGAYRFHFSTLAPD